MSGSPKLPYRTGSMLPSPLSNLDEDLIAALGSEVYKSTGVRALATRSDMCKLLKRNPKCHYSINDETLKMFQTEHGLETSKGLSGILEYLVELSLVTKIDIRIESNMKRIAVKYKWREPGDEQVKVEYVEV